MQPPSRARGPCELEVARARGLRLNVKPLARLERAAKAGKLRVMTRLLEKAFAEAVKLPKKEQDKLAKRMLAEIESERRWDEAFARSADQLGTLAAEALKEHRKGRTKPLNPERL